MYSSLQKFLLLFQAESKNIILKHVKVVVVLVVVEVVVVVAAAIIIIIMIVIVSECKLSRVYED
jgi:hypothetical protein